MFANITSERVLGFLLGAGVTCQFVALVTTGNLLYLALIVLVLGSSLRIPRS